MYLYTVLAFVFLFWQAETPGRWRAVADSDIAWTLFAVLSQPILLWSAGRWVTRRTMQRLKSPKYSAADVQRRHHRATLCLRLIMLLGFGCLVLLTRWPEWFAWGRVTPALQIVGDLVVLSPYFLGAVMLWIATYPLEREIHEEAVLSSNTAGDTTPCVTLGSYLDFQIRHHLLIVAVPMILILFAADLTRGYESQLRDLFRWRWTPDAALGVAAAAVFVTAPLLLRRIWRTEPLEAGPLRTRLDELCERIGLRCRGILIWRSDGLMINAAVMGIFAPVRFVLLSDALIASLSPQQIEAVFGHEAGHVRHRHIQHFLVFAFVGWLVVAGVMELLVRVTVDANGANGLPTGAIEGIGVLATMIFWGVCFGWVSRRYERQADLFGARCAAPPAAECTVPCGVHVDESTVLADPDRVCATGAAVFASALERVASLNGIPTDERSWRHSSISSRIRFLASVAGDSELARRFERTVRRIQRVIWIVAVLGAGLAAWYWMVVPQPAVLRMTVGQ